MRIIGNTLTLALMYRNIVQELRSQQCPVIPGRLAKGAAPACGTPKMTAETSVPLSFKLRPEERARLREAAESVHLGPSTFAAEAVRQAIGTIRLRPLPRRLDDVADAIRAATGQLGYLGNNLNQLARASNGGASIDPQALAAIRAGLIAIDARLTSALAAS